MANIPKKVEERIASGIKKFQAVLASARSRDIGEADTVTIITDMLAEVFGYDKYSEVTSEYAIRGTYCDLATKLDGILQILIEVKAIGIDLKDQHVKQAIDYAVNQGVDWVVLTNGVAWRIYKVTYAKPIDQELVVEFDFLTLNPKSQQHLDTIYLICKEGWIRSVLGEYHTQKQALSRFYLGAVVLCDPVLEMIRRQLRRVSPDVKIEIEEIKTTLIAEVLKREVVEGEKAEEARKKVAKSAGNILRTVTPKSVAPSDAPPPVPEAVAEEAIEAGDVGVVETVQAEDAPPTE